MDFSPSITLGPTLSLILVLVFNDHQRQCALAWKMDTVKLARGGPYQKKLPNKSVGLIKAWKWLKSGDCISIS